MRAWGAGVSAGYCVLGVAAFVADIPGSELLFGLCAVLTLTLSLVVAPLLKPRGHDDGDGGVSPPRARRSAAAVVAGVRARVPRLRGALDIRPRPDIACR